MGTGTVGVLDAELAAVVDGGVQMYSVEDHLEGLRFLEGDVSDEEVCTLCAVLGATLPGLENSVPEDYHANLVGKMAYNSIGVCPDGGGDDKVSLFCRCDCDPKISLRFCTLSPSLPHVPRTRSASAPLTAPPASSAAVSSSSRPT